MIAAIRKVVEDRLLTLGFETLRLPLGVGGSENHVPILVTKDIGTKERVLVFFGERYAEPGILSWRVIGEEGIKVGSLLEFMHAVLFGPTPKSGHQSPGLIIANPAQLLWWRGGGRAVSLGEWLNLPRQSAVHEAARVDEVKNRIEGNRDFEEHVEYVLGKVVSKLVKKTAKIDVVGIEYTGSKAVEYLSAHWDEWSHRLTGIALVAPQFKIQDLIDQGAPERFVEFISKRCRAYFVSPSPVETLMTGREEFGCNCYASGEHMYQESAMVRCWRSVLDWFNMLYATPGHEEIEFVMVDKAENLEDVKLGW